MKHPITMTQLSSIGQRTLCVGSLVFFTSLSLGGEVLEDLNGSFLFGLDTPPAPGTELVEFELFIPTEETRRIINGRMLGGISGIWEETYSITVDGELIFGENFPFSTVFIYDSWTIRVNGILRIDNSITRFEQVDFNFQTSISGGGMLVVEPMNTLFTPNIFSSGTIWIKPSATISASDDAGIRGNGTLIIDENAEYNGQLFNQTVEMKSNSALAGDSPEDCRILLPSDGPATISLYSSGAFGGALRSSEVVIPDIPTQENTSTLLPDLDSNGTPLFNSTVTLQEATGTDIGSLDRILILEYFGWSDTNDTLVAPPATLDKDYQLRWGTDGLYVLTVPLNWCPADLNFDGQLNFFDVSVFLKNFASGTPWANFTPDQILDRDDVDAFIDLINAGCP